jgi:iron complex outermembrane recepter protein
MRVLARLKLGVSAAAVAFITALPAHAQDPQTPPAAASTGGAQLEDIVVTAQKRGQNLQDVPLSVSAFTGDTLAAAGITNAIDVQNVDSSLTLSTGGGGTVVPFMRGVGNAAGINVSNEASVPLYIDDVYYSRISNAYLDLANVDRIEVLKGPQGTLFGRNATAGLINIYTRTPNRDHVTAEATLGYGNYNTVTAKGYISAPITDKIASDFSISYKHQGDGWGRNIFNGHDVWKEHFVSMRSKTVADVTDTTQVTLIGWYVKQFTQQGSQYSRVPGSIGATPDVCGFSIPGRNNPTLCATYGPSRPLSVDQNGSFYNINVAYDPDVRMTTYGGSFKLQQDLDFADFVSITSYRHDRESWLAAGEPTPQPFLAYRLNIRGEDYTQELQLKSKADSAFDWIIGAYYLHAVEGYDPTRVFGDAFGAGSSGPDLNNPTLTVYQDIVGVQTMKSLSGFGQATFHVIPENTNITLGLRYSSDKVSGRGSSTLYIPGVATIPLAPETHPGESFNKLTYKVVVDHKFAQDMMGFVSFSRGYKAGTFNVLPLGSAPTRPEVVQAYEIGMKSEFFDRHLRLNFAVYQNDVTNPQVQVIETVGGIGAVSLVNADKLRSKGVELSGTALLSSGFTLRFAADYLDSKYLSYMNAPFLYQRGAPLYGLGQCDNAVPANNPPGVNCPVGGNAKGYRQPQSPKFKGNIGANYVINTDMGKFVFDTNVSYTSKYFWSADNNYSTKAFALWDASLAFSPAFAENLTVRAWGKNLTSHKYSQTVLENVGDNANTMAPAAPRTYGVEAIVKF